MLFCENNDFLWSCEADVLAELLSALLLSQENVVTASCSVAKNDVLAFASSCKNWLLAFASSTKYVDLAFVSSAKIWSSCFLQNQGNLV